MNDIAKKSISEKFTKALQTEKMQVKDAALAIGIMPTYASMMKNEALWGKCPIPVWDKTLAWVNSGLSLEKYAEKHNVVQEFKKAWLETPPITKLQPEELAQEVKRAFGRDEDPRKESAAEEERRLMAALKPEEDFIQPIDPDPALQRTETARLKVCLDIEINLVINGQKVQVK